MSAPASRRGFIHGLTTLPLVGGSVALVGAPSAVAGPVTPGMLATYSAWLFYEREALHRGALRGGGYELIPFLNPAIRFHHDGTGDDRRRVVEAQRRAPIVLAAAGCPLTSPETEQAWGEVFRLDRGGVGR